MSIKEVDNEYNKLVQDPIKFSKQYFKKNENWWFYSKKDIKQRIYNVIMYKNSFGMDYAVPGTLGGLGQNYVQPNLP